MTSRRTFLASAAAALLVSRPRSLFARFTGQGISLSFNPWLEIDSAALRHNVRAVVRLSEGKPVIAVVKNNAYGLGLAEAGPLLDAMDEVRMLAVVRPDEALALRAAGLIREDRRRSGVAA